MPASIAGTPTGSRAASPRSSSRCSPPVPTAATCSVPAVSLADVCIVPQMYNARRFKCDTAPYPTLNAICAHLEALPAFAAASPDVQPQARAG